MNTMKRRFALLTAALCALGVAAIKSAPTTEAGKATTVRTKISVSPRTLLADDGVETHGKKGKRA